MVFVKALLRRADNFMYIVKRTEISKMALLVDLVNDENYGELAEQEGIEIAAVLTTHHHYDHVGGNIQFSKKYPMIPMYGGDYRIPEMNRHMDDGEETALVGLNIRCLSTPCHTSGHMCYYITDSLDPSQVGVVFTGDTLFIAGCGRFFEGTAPQMHRALNEVLAKLPDQTLVYPGHEYTLANLKFAHHVEPSNEQVAEKLRWAEGRSQKGEFTVPSTIGEEKATNPFMRVTTSEEIQKTVGATDPFEVMSKLRDMKNKF